MISENVDCSSEKRDMTEGGDSGRRTNWPERLQIRACSFQAAPTMPFSPSFIVHRGSLWLSLPPCSHRNHFTLTKSITEILRNSPTQPTPLTTNGERKRSPTTRSRRHARCGRSPHRSPPPAPAHSSERRDAHVHGRQRRAHHAPQYAPSPLSP